MVFIGHLIFSNEPIGSVSEKHVIFPSSLICTLCPCRSAQSLLKCHTRSTYLWLKNIFFVRERSERSEILKNMIFFLLFIIVFLFKLLFSLMHRFNLPGENLKMKTQYHILVQTAFLDVKIYFLMPKYFMT